MRSVSRTFAVLVVPVAVSLLAAGAVATASAGLGGTAAGSARTDLPAPTRTSPVSGAATAGPDAAHPPTLVGVRSGRHERFDRTVFDFTGGTPAYRVAYGPLVGVGTGAPIPLAGPADLRITFSGGFAYDVDTGASTVNLNRVLNPRLPTLRQIRSGGAFEGRILYGLGLADRVGFRVLRLTNPPRIAVDVAHQPTQPFGTARFMGGGGADRVRITGVRAARHPGYDRVVFDLATARTPLTTVAYTRNAPATIHVGLTGMTTAPATIAAPRWTTLNLPRLQGVRLVAYENGTVSAFVTTSRRTGFRVMLLTHPTRIVVDVRH
jgi:hypothetical protein